MTIDSRNSYLLRYVEVILACTWFNWDFMLTEQPVRGLSNIHCTSALITKKKIRCTDQKYRMPRLKIKIKCLPSNAGTPLMIRVLSQEPRPYWLAVYMLIYFCCFKSWRNVSLTCLIFLVLTRYKPMLKPMLLRSGSSQFSARLFWAIALSLAEIKLFYSYYRLFTISTDNIKSLS